MIDRLILWSLHNRLLVIIGAVVLLGWGAFEAARMPVDVFPDLTAPTVTVVTEAHGMAPEEVETLITFPIESALNAAAGVRRVRSNTTTGSSIVYVEFDWDQDLYRTRQIVAEKLQVVSGILPPGVDPPIMSPMTSVMGDIMFLGLTSDTHDAYALKTTADWVIRPRLQSVQGVAQVMPIGGDTKQFQVMLDPQRLLAHDLTPGQVVEALRQTDENVSAGFYHEGGREYLIRGLGRIRDLDDIGEALITLRDGQPLLVRHVAEVRIGAAVKRGTGGVNGQDGVTIGIRKQQDANTLALTRELDQVLADLDLALPEGMVLHRNLFRQSDFIEVAVANVFQALRDGSLLVVLIVLIFLASIRATAITVLAIPLSLMVAVIVLKLTGATINTMTLGGMAIAIGALVDDAIIDVENVARRLRENATFTTPKPVLTVIYEASKEIRSSIVFATLIIMLVFLPLFFLQGVEGRLLQPLGFAYIIALVASLLTALTVTPVLCSLVLTRSKMVRENREGAAARALKRFYQPVLVFALPRWKSISFVSFLLLLATLAGMTGMGRSFLPDFNEGSLTINLIGPPGIALAESDRLGRMAEQILLEHPEVRTTSRRTGRGDSDDHAQGVHATQLEVDVDIDAAARGELLERLRNSLSVLPGIAVILGQPISHRIDHMLSGTQANIAVKIFGDDLARLRTIAAQVEARMQGVPGMVDLTVEAQTQIPMLVLRLKRDVIASYGLSIHEVGEAIETAFVGTEVSRVLQGQTAFDLVVRFEEDVLARIDTIRQTQIVTPTGAQVPLHVLAEIRKDIGPNTISRENARRKIVVMCNVADRALSEVVGDIRAAVGDDLLPEGYHIEYGGQFESAASASQTLLLLGLVSVLGIFVLLNSATRSVRDAALIMVNLPLALIGGVAGVYLTGGVLSVASIIGFITLFGIATRNGILLVSHIRHLLFFEGVTDLRDAVQRGAMERLSPIMMTALTAALALIPLAMKGGEPGGEIEAPMAVVILCGLVSSTLLNLIVVPALYLRFGKPARGSAD